MLSTNVTGTSGPACPAISRIAAPSSSAPGAQPTDLSRRTSTLWQRKRVADAINWFWANDRPRAEAVAAQASAYRVAVHAAGLPVDSDVLQLSGVDLSLKLAGRLLWLALLFPAALLGAVYAARTMLGIGTADE